MADPFSIIAGVVGVSAVALHSSRVLFETIDGIRNAPEELTSIHKDLRSFNNVVLSLESALKEPDIQKVIATDALLVQLVGNLQEPLFNCSEALNILMPKILEHAKPTKGDDEKGLRFSSIDFKWYFTKKEVKDSMNRLQQRKMTLDSAMQTLGTVCNVRLLAATGQDFQPSANLASHHQSMDAGSALKSYAESIAPSSPTESSSYDTESNPFDQTPPPSETLVGPRERLQKAAANRAALLDAARNGDELMVELCIAEGADANSRGPDGKSGLHIAAQNGHEAVIEMLLKHGADVNIKSIPRGTAHERKFSGGRTALHWAAFEGHESVAQVLLDNGADVAAVNPTLRTALQEAVMNGHTGMTRLLIDHGAPINAQDHESFTPLHEAANKCRLPEAELLLNHRANTEIATNQLDHHLNPSSSEAAWGSHRTPLQVAVDRNYLVIVQLLLARGANPNCRTSKGATPLHGAAARGLISIARELLDARSDIYAKDSEWRQTPLQKAVAAKQTLVVNLLRERGADE